MKKTKLSSLLLGATLLTSSLYAQKNGICYTDEYNALREQQYPELVQKRLDLEEYIANFKQTYDPTTNKATIIIPVVVHNITHDGGIGYVSKANIDAQIARMNEDFQGLNADMAQVRPEFQPYIATLDVKFRLARLDPNGNCTEGIVRAESPYSFNTSTDAAENVKAVSQWDENKYFNIWVIDEIQSNGGGGYVAGYAQFPTAMNFPYGTNNNTYGIVCVDQNFNGSDRTMTHEMGHCLNLLHTFQGNCGNNSCSSSGDYCCDTPPTSNGGFDCSAASTCSQDANYGPYNANMNDQFENHMSYSNCRKMFTLDQKTRMMAILNSTSISQGLAKLSTASNLSATGTNDPYEQNPICLPLGANFKYNKEYVCEGDQVVFSDDGTYNATPTQWDWTFTGGTPSTSNVASPSITYNTQGVYGATYIPGSAAGWATTPSVKNNIITVSSIVADYTLPFSEGMENTTTFSNEWTIETENGNGWENTSTAAYTGSRSLRVYNYSNSSGDITEVTSPSYDLSSMTNPKLDYKWAFARKTSGGNDQFIIYTSTDCGATWAIKAVKAGSSMATVAATNNIFTPSSTADWKSATVDLSTLASESNVRFKFYFKNAGGNNFFLDDINISGDTPTGLSEVENVNNLKVFPNPTKESAVISFNLTSNVKNLKIVLRDVLGQEVTQLVSGASFTAGKYTVAIDQQQKLSSGLYFIEFNADNNVQIEKLIVE